jgi:DNA replication and repair protein RecF
MAKGRPTFSRQFTRWLSLLDRGVYQLQPAHLKRMAEYHRVIRHKNSLLRSDVSLYTKSTYELLDVWDTQIAKLGSRIVKARQSYLSKVRSKLAAQRNAFRPEALDIKYLGANEITSGADLADVQFQLTKRLKENRDTELRLKRCVTGPHRDDLVIEIDGCSLQRYVSTGYQRSALLAYRQSRIASLLDRRRRYRVRCGKNQRSAQSH